LRKNSRRESTKQALCCLISKKNKLQVMSATQIRTEVHQIIDRLDDESLRVVHLMLDAYLQGQEEDPIVSYDLDGTPRTASELKILLGKEVEAARQGNYITIDELEEKSEQWVSRNTK
jgi:hypothetical protein